MSDPILKMPEPVENGSFIPTLDKQGAVWLFIDEVTQAYLDFAAKSRGIMLEIAAGYGHIVIKALEAGATKVFANDLSTDQLAILRSRVPSRYASQFECCPGAFPEHLAFPNNSFDAIYNARLFHFFTGERIRSSLALMYRWLKPNGRVFLVNDAIYRTIFKPLIPVYEKQVASGEEWPGFIKDVRSCIPEYLHPSTFPAMMNFMDPVILKRELALAGFRVLASDFCPYTGNFALGRLDGREIAAAIGVKG